MALSANERRIVELIIQAKGDADLKRLAAELRETRRAAEATQQSLAGIGGGLSQAATFAKGFVGALGVSTVISWSRAILDAADSLDAAAEQAGIGVERYQSLKEAFRALEVDGQKFETGMERLATTLSDVLAGDTNAATKALDRLGISAKITSGEISTTDELVDALAKSQKAMADDTTFASDMVDLLGRKLGVDYANALKSGKLATEEMRVATEEFGVVTADQIKVLADASETFDQFQHKAGNAILIWAADTINAISSVGDAISDVATGFVAFSNSIARGDFINAGSNAVKAATQRRDAILANERGAGWWNGPKRDETPAPRPTTRRPSAPRGGGAAAREAERFSVAVMDTSKALADLAAQPVPEVLQIGDDLAASAESMRKFYEAGASLKDARLDDQLQQQADAAQQAQEQWGFLADAAGQATYDIISGTERISQAVKRMVASIVADLVRLAAQKLIMSLLGISDFGNAGTSIWGKLFGAKSAAGNAFGTAGVITAPTMHGIRGGGIGIAGEAGPEAILPLARNGAGQLGVVAAGAGAVNVTVNNNVPGAAVQVRETDRGVQIDVIERQLADRVRRGGSALPGALENTYRTGRFASAYG